MDKNMTVFQNENLMMFDCGNISADLEEIVINLVRVTSIDYPSLSYSVVDAGDNFYLIINKHDPTWRAFEYGKLI